MKEFDHSIVKDPEIFMQNRIPAHSDHLYYLPGKDGNPYDGKALLNGQWKFSYAENYDLAVKDFYREDHDVSGWDEIRVPAHIQMEGYGKPQYVNTQFPWDGSEEIEPGQIPTKFNPTASYVRFFSLPDEMKGKRVFISFQGVESGFAFWLNGQYAGYSEDSFTPSEFEITGIVREGENRLAVQVYRWTSGSWCEDQDFFRFSGIFRDVYLYTIPDVHVRDLKIRTLLDDDYRDADLALDFLMEGEGKAELTLLPPGVKADVILAPEMKNTAVLKEEFDLTDGTSVRFPLSSPDLWSAEKPDLYTLILEVYDGEGKLNETIIQKVGFRRFELKNNVMMLNGKRIVFKGVNRHEFTCDAGRVMTEEIIRKDLITMKQNNINAIRTCHYPNISALYRAADEYGLYVIDETNMETHGVMDAIFSANKGISFAVPGDRPEFLNMVLDRANSMYQRDKNHACILIWSCGNESFGGRDIFEMSEQFRRLDSTRLVHYEGVKNDRRYPGTSDMESQMYTTVEGIKEFLSEHNDKPFICCEYSHAMGNSCGAIWKYTALAYEEELYQGGFIWDYIDQSITTHDRYGNEYQGYGGDFGDRPCDFNFSGNGIVYGDDRSPSPKMQEVKYCYQNIEVAFEGDDFIVTNRNLFTNTDAFDCVITVLKDGEEAGKYTRNVSVDPLQSGRFPLDVPLPEDACEADVIVSFLLKEDTLWAKAGHEAAFGQKAVKIAQKKAAPAEKPLKVVHGWQNTGVFGEDFEALFSGPVGGLISYKYKGKQLIMSMPKPNFWRPMTDNDIANLLPFRAGQWKGAGMYSNIRIGHGYDRTLYEVTETENSVKITYTYHLPVRPAKDCEMVYEVFGDGTIRTTLSMEPSSDVGELPEFSVLFLMDADFDRVRWYGPGPDETYADRCLGGKLGIYENHVSDNMARYLVPQECGNKVDVRWASVTDESGTGLCFTMEPENLQFSALPYTPQEIDCAAHPYELPAVQHTCVRVGYQMGVGGDDTWGALVHPEYLIDNTGKLQISFTFRGIG